MRRKPKRRTWGGKGKDTIDDDEERPSSSHRCCTCTCARFDDGKRGAQMGEKTKFVARVRR